MALRPVAIVLVLVFIVLVSAVPLKDHKSFDENISDNDTTDLNKTSQAISNSSTRSNNKKHNDGPNLHSSTARVVHGSPVTDPTEYPFVVDLSYHGRHISSTRFCTGTLIARNVILTAAHCVLNNGYTSPVFATVGRIELDDRHADNAHSRTFRTVASIVHPEYSGIGSPKDVALLLMNASSSATPVKLSHSTPGIDKHGWVVGYGIQKLGTLEEAGRPVEILSGRLQKTALKITERSLCDIPSASFTTAEGMLCTAGVKPGASACRGDSGGGLFVKRHVPAKDEKPEWTETVQVGVVSYGDRECASEEAGIFTDVAHVREWVLAGVDKLLDALHPVRMHNSNHNDAGEKKKHRGSPGRVFRYSKMLIDTMDM